MFFKKKDKESQKPTAIKKNSQFKNSDSAKDSDTSDKMKQPLVDTSFVFFEDK